MTPLVTFLEQTRSILHTLAHHAQEIERIVGLKFQNSLGSVPRGTHYLTMLYHQVHGPDLNFLSLPQFDLVIGTKILLKCSV